MILLAACLAFYFPFLNSEEKRQQQLNLEKSCYYIQNLCFRDYEFLQIDRNSDLLISFQESKLYRIELFLAADEDSDGKLDTEEFLKATRDLSIKQECKSKKIKKAYQKKIDLEFKKFDLNSDLRITALELETYGSLVFDEIDMNDDNQVSVEELKKFNQKLN